MMRSNSDPCHRARAAILLLFAAMTVAVAGCAIPERAGIDGDAPADTATSVTDPIVQETTETSAISAEGPGSPISVPPVTAAATWPALTYEGWVDQVELVVVGTVIEVSEPTSSGNADTETAQLVEEFQTITVKVDQILKKRDVSLIKEIEEGSTVELVHSITHEGSVFAKDMTGRRTVAAVGVRDPLLGSDKKEQLLTVGLMSSYIEIDGAAILYADAFAASGYSDRLALTPDERAIADSGEETLSVSSIDKLTGRARNTRVPLEEQLGYDELFGERIPDQEGPEGP